MSTTETRPAEYALDGSAPEALACTVGLPTEILEPRDVPLGGPRAMNVRRTLPQRARSFIGAWCFCDHYGPDDVAVTGGMRVPPHPHTSLQTVSWLFSGAIEHRDSVGSHQIVRPGEVNLMTAGYGISHSEVSTPETSVLHGVQLWTALPSHSANHAPLFEHHVPPSVDLGDGRMQVFVGSLGDAVSPVITFSPLVGAEIVLEPGAEVTIDVDAPFEHGILLDSGAVRVGDTDVPPRHLAYVPPGARALRLAAGPDGATRVVLIGGAPLGEQIIMWWNFVGRSHEEIVAARDEWQAAGSRFGVVDGYHGDRLPAPALPNVRLRPRD